TQHNNCFAKVCKTIYTFGHLQAVDNLALTLYVNTPRGNDERTKEAKVPGKGIFHTDTFVPDEEFYHDHNDGSGEYDYNAGLVSPMPETIAPSSDGLDAVTTAGTYPEKGDLPGEVKTPFGGLEGFDPVELLETPLDPDRPQPLD